MLVPEDAQLPMAHSDADSHFAASAMSPGTLVLGAS